MLKILLPNWKIIIYWQTFLDDRNPVMASVKRIERRGAFVRSRLADDTSAV